MELLCIRDPIQASRWFQASSLTNINNFERAPNFALSDNHFEELEAHSVFVRCLTLRRPYQSALLTARSRSSTQAVT
jgi:hypothetical protein